MKERTYVAIDLKSFYASVECVDRGLDPLQTNLVVADASRTEKTICLAVTPSLKAYGISGRARLFEVVQAVRNINALRRNAIHGRSFTGSSCDAEELRSNPYLELSYLTAPPRMQRYEDVSTQIYNIYMRYCAPMDVHVYSIDEVFIDVTGYLSVRNMTAREFTMLLVREVFRATGITATAGIGTNLYLCKIAMDIVAKKMPPDRDGVRVAELDEMGYRQLLWEHRPITDFWQVGRGKASQLERCGIFTMGDVARCSVVDAELLYRQFGVNAELLIDHAWGIETCTMADIKAYQAKSTSLSSGQVMSEPCDYERGRLLLREMAELLALKLVEKNLLTDGVTVDVCYDAENLKDTQRSAAYRGAVQTDHYGRRVPAKAHGSARLPYTNSSKEVVEAVMQVYETIADPTLLQRRYGIAVCNLKDPQSVAAGQKFEQMDLFGVCDAARAREEALQKERKLQQTTLYLQSRYGANAILKGMNLQKGAMTVERNGQIGGHRA